MVDIGGGRLNWAILDIIVFFQIINFGSKKVQK